MINLFVTKIGHDERPGATYLWGVYLPIYFLDIRSPIVNYVGTEEKRIDHSRIHHVGMFTTSPRPNEWLPYPHSLVLH